MEGVGGDYFSSISLSVLTLLTCIVVWHFCKVSDRKKVERVNERGLRAVFCNWNLSYHNLLKHANLTSLYHISVFKVKHKLLPKNVDWTYSAKRHLITI